MTKNQRKKLLVDKSLQSALAKRTVMYWCTTWLVVFTLPIMVRTITEQLPFNMLATELIKDFWFPITISLLMLPIVVWDSFRFSSRVAGPVFRINEAIQEKRETGKNADVIRVRDQDFCQGLVDNVNQLIEMLDEKADEPAGVAAKSQRTEQTSGSVN